MSETSKQFAIENSEVNFPSHIYENSKTADKISAWTAAPGS